MRKSQESKLRYPENKVLRGMLKGEDLKRIAKASGYKMGALYMILNGHRRMTLHLQEAIIEFLEQKKSLAKRLESLIGKE